MKDAGDFDKVTILKPYSFVLVDEEKETVAELLLIDDDTILVNDELLKGLDKELDDFLKDLLEKIKKNCWRNKISFFLNRDRSRSTIKDNRKQSGYVL